MKPILIIILIFSTAKAQTAYDKGQNVKITALQKKNAALVTVNTKNTTTINGLKKSVKALESANTKNKTDISSIQNSARRSADTTLKNTVASLSKSLSALKEQMATYKGAIDSLKWVIKSNTIKVDTTAGSDFTIKNGVMIVNKPNLDMAIKREVLRWVPLPKVAVKKKKK